MSNGQDEYDEEIAESTDPSVNDVLAQQMGTDYDQVEPQDKQEIQEDLKDQATKPEDLEDEVPKESTDDDTDTTDSQLISS
jgi:hypothetical protein